MISRRTRPTGQEADAFYHWQALYDRKNVGYTGPAFGFGSIPDEYTLKTFAHTELRPHHRPVMAEIDLVSSHGPWAPLPRLVPWPEVGDQSIYQPMVKAGPRADQMWQHPAAGKRAYATPISYSIDSLVAFVQHVHDPNLVMVMLGDHQTRRSGVRPTRQPRRADLYRQ